MFSFFGRSGLTLLACLAFSTPVSGQVLFEMNLDRFAEVGFTYESFANGGFVVENDYFTMDVEGFGGAGVNTNFDGIFPDFSNSEAFLEVEVRVGANNTAEDFKITLADDDGFAANGNGIQEDYQYQINLAGLATDAFTVVPINLDTFVFNDTTFQSEPGDDGAPNFGLFQVQIQSTFDSPLRTDVDIRRVSLVMGTPPVISVPGDFNGDGAVDLADLDFYNGNINATVAANPELADLDLDGSGTIDAADLNQHVETLVQTSNGVVGTAIGDINLDGSVDVLGDAAALVSNLGNSATSWGDGDLNGDQVVDVLGDAAALVANLGFSNEPAASSVSAAAVPEPGTAVVLLTATLLAGSRRRR